MRKHEWLRRCNWQCECGALFFTHSAGMFQSARRAYSYRPAAWLVTLIFCDMNTGSGLGNIGFGGGVHREKYMQCTQLSVRKSTEKKGEVSQIEHWGAVSFGESYNRKWDEEKGISAGSKTTRFKSSKQPSYPWERTWTREYRDGKDIRVNPLLSLSSSKSSFFLLG